MAKITALFNLGAELKAIFHNRVGRRAAAGDPVAVSGLPTMTLSPATRESLTKYLKNPEALDSRQRNVLEKYLDQILAGGQRVGQSRAYASVWRN
jgi:hypothetical protein